MGDNRNVRKKRLKVKVSHVMIALLIAVVAAFAIFRLKVKFKLKARMDAVAAAGYPVTCAELDRWYSIPPDVENAAYTMEDAFAALNTWDKDKSRPLPLLGRAELPPRTEPLSPEMKSLMSEYVADNNEALELLHVGAAIENCRYTVDLSPGLNTLMPNLSEMRTCVRLLELEAILHAEAGDAESATRSAIACFGIPRSLSGLPMTIGQLIRAACQGASVETIEQIVNRTELTDSQLAALAECVRESERVSDMSYVVIGERCMGINFFHAPEAIGQNVGGGGGVAVPFGPLMIIYGALGLTDADMVIYLDLMDGYLKGMQLPMHERQEAVDAVTAKLESTSKAHVLLHTIAPALSRIASIEMRAIADLRAADAGLAVQRYRLAADRLPDRLSDLVPTYLKSVPTDPFDGQELRYRKLEPGFVVYSIGEDLSDDGGKERPRRRKSGEEPPKWDVIFVVER